MEKNLEIRLEHERKKPFTRWWWFREEIKEEDIKNQLDWIKKNNFGGVEISWIYPSGNPKNGPKWLSPEWSRLVEYTKQYAEKQDLGCDFTFGSMWPFGGSFVKDEHASKDYYGLSPQKLDISWEMGDNGKVNIIDHLSEEALIEYARIMNEGLKKSLQGKKSALFCDSWEIDSRNLWTKGLEERFIEKFGYDLIPFIEDRIPDKGAIYDYRKIISELIIKNFYKKFTEIAHEQGAISRVQCHGSPTDLLEAYCSVDIPESEAMLFDTPFSKIAASAALISGKKVVSAESFTCLYGFNPAKFKKRESLNDIKLIADSLFANGVNHIIWHGMPFNGKGEKKEFYATTHVGPDSFFAEKLPKFNRYLEKVSGFMQQGKTYSKVATYLPIEDNWIKGTYSEELRRPGGVYHFDLRHVKTPEELAGHNPLWVSMGILKNAAIEDNRLVIGENEFESLYLDSDYLDPESLEKIVDLAKQGLPICLKKQPCEPGYKKTTRYSENLEELRTIKNVNTRFIPKSLPLIEGNFLPEYWCRTTENNDTYLFLAHPKSKELKYPLTYDQSYCSRNISLDLRINLRNKSKDFRIKFRPYQSALLKFDEDLNVSEEDIVF